MAKLVKIHTLETKNDFSEANNILEMSYITAPYSAEDYYKERTEQAKKFVATYEIEIDRKGDYEEFKTIANNATYHLKEEGYYNLTYNERCLIDDERQEKRRWLRTITFEDWKNGKYQNGIKLNKKLRKEGFPQSVMDFYATQIKTEKVVYFTITDRVHDVLGMSNFAKEDSFDGYNGTSCQDTRHDTEYQIHLIGAIADSNLLIGQLHYDLEDVEDMQDKLKARILMRQWKVKHDEKEYSICKGVKLYGNQATKSELKQCLECLEAEGLGIASETY